MNYRRVSLTEALAELEASDPEVAKARDRLEQTIFEITRLPPKRRFRKDLGGRSMAPLDRPVRTVDGRVYDQCPVPTCQSNGPHPYEEVAGVLVITCRVCGHDFGWGSAR